MPNLAKFGSGGSRAFGFRGKVFKLFTQTFTSSQNFTMPNGVTRLQSFTGKAQDGSPGEAPSWGDFINGTGFGGHVTYIGPDAPAGISSATIEAQADAEWQKFPTTHTAEGVTLTFNHRHYEYGRSDSWLETVTVRVYPGQTKSKVGAWGSSYTTPLPGYPDLNYKVGNMQIYYEGYPATNGASGSGFGINLPGGEGGGAPTITQTNVAVNPNQTYSLSIPSGGYITITYLA